MDSAFSLANPFRMDSGLNFNQYLDQQVCLYCDCKILDFKNFVDVKGLLDEVIYHVHELTFDCGHLNLVFTQLNDGYLEENRCLSDLEFEDFTKGSMLPIRQCWHASVLNLYEAISNQDFGLANSLASDLRNEFPNDPYSYIWSAKVALKEFDFEAYEDYFQQASQLEPVLHQIELNDEILEEESFILGKVFVAQDQTQRRLFINQQNQGGLLIDSSKEGLERLSTIPESFCSIIFYPAAKNYPDGKLLMLGLGSGSGVISLLSEFESLSITVVEKYQVVIDLALKHFHYLKEFISQGRLNIVCDEGLAYIKQISEQYMEPTFDAVCLDMYSGEEGFSFSKEPEQLATIACVARSTWMNYIGRYGSDDFSLLLSSFKSANIDFNYSSAVFENFQTLDHATNLLLSTNDFSSDLHLKLGDESLRSQINVNLGALARNKVSNKV